MTASQPQPPAPARIDRLVVGVDRSPESLYALELSAAIGAPRRAALTIVHVQSRPLALSISPNAAAEFDRAEEEIGELIAAEARTRLGSYEGEWTVVNRRGAVAQELLAAADEIDADIVVVGHRSHGPIRDAILGSVAGGTVHRSRRTVIVAIPPAKLLTESAVR